MSDQALELPFDQYQRYRLVADILEEVRPEGRRLTILDVGGRTALLRLFLPDDVVHLVDVEASDVSDLVLGDGSCLPFATDAVDAVVNFDTLEHVPPAFRAQFLAECRRVARSWVVVAGPFDTEGVEEAETLLEAFIHDKLGEEHRYLAEHKANGLPHLDETETALADGGGAVGSIGHANLERWLALMCLELYLDRDPPLRAIAKSYFRFYNSALYESDHAGPVYRHAVVAAYQGAGLPDAANLLQPPVAPAGSLDVSMHIAQEVLRFDVQRDAIQPEWQRLEQVNGDLHLDLQGHKDTMLVMQEINLEQRDVIEELRQVAMDIRSNEDLLEGMVEDTNAERAKIRDLLEDERSEFAKVTEALQSDLSGHKAVVATLREQCETIPDLHAIVERLQSEVHAELERLHTLNVQLGEKQRCLDMAREELTRERDTTHRLRAMLTDRWGNLLRALGLK